MSGPRLPTLAALLVAVSCAPDDRRGGGGGSTPGGGGDVDNGGQGVDDGGPLPEREAEIRRQFEEQLRVALGACAETLLEQEPRLMGACSHTSEFTPLLQALADAYEPRYAALPGRDLPLVIATNAGELDRSERRLNLLECAANPMDPAKSLNAFALVNSAYVLDPLLFALTEAAVYWVRLREMATAAGGDVDPEELVGGWGIIFADNEAGAFGGTVPEDEVMATLRDSADAVALVQSAAGFLVFHEIGHANLEHSLFKHMMRVGVDGVLGERGVTLDEAKQRELDAKLLELAVATERQADIYAATLMSQIGMRWEGPAMFFAAVTGMLKETGVCDADVLPPDDLRACLLHDSPMSDHPPFDERVSTVRRILEDGEDLSGLLEPSKLFELAED